LRVNQGECLRITLRNDLAKGEPASLHLARTGAPAIATNPEAIAQQGATVTYEWWVAEDEPEGTHYFHSHGDDRLQTSHGLFGALVVEPKGSVYRDPLRGNELRSGWSALVDDPGGSDFREFTILYHEVGNERYRHLDRNGRLVS
jgi:FtsP/CotA-like multicopper oxidase with cupredoxin domain